MKKIVSLLFSFILIFTFSQIAYADASDSLSNFAKTKTYTDGQFTDVSPNDWFAENVKSIYELGLINGTSESTFSPDSELTFAEVVALSSRIHSIYTGNNYEFENTSPWYQTYYDYNIQNMIIPFELDFNAKVTRGEFAWVIISTLPPKEFEAINNIPDGTIPDVGDYDYVVYPLYRAGILSGSDEYGTFNHSDTIKRSEVAAIITRVVDKSLRKEFQLTSATAKEIISEPAPTESKTDIFNSLLTEENKNTMYEKCKSDIKKQLTNPSTVRFNSVTYSVSEEGIRVAVKYQAANAFGVYSDGLGIYLFNERLYMKRKY